MCHALSGHGSRWVEWKERMRFSTQIRSKFCETGNQWTAMGKNTHNTNLDNLNK